MKAPFLRQTLFTLTVVIAAVGSTVGVEAQTTPPTASDNALPSEIDPASPVAQVIKLVQAGADINVINAYVANSASTFNLDADKIVSLKDTGVPTDVINAMMTHDKNLSASATMPVPAPVSTPTPAYTPAPAPDMATDNGLDTAPPAIPVTLDYFDNTLTPYGSWIQVNGYGRCWRPTEVIYNPTWSPYCDRGHWVYTDCGWYWDSDYAWGTTFHYGRWFRDAQLGWCWSPDTQWAPSWVVWRSNADYCGWAPLPPFAVYTPGLGFFYRGASVSVDFNFGLGADCFVFLSPSHFCDRRPRVYCLDRPHVTQVFKQTTIINNYNVRNRFVVNNGISVEQINARTHQSIQPVRVGSLPNARRQGWQGNVNVRPGGHNNTGNNQSPGNFSGNHGQPRSTPVVRDNHNGVMYPNNTPPVMNQSDNQAGNHHSPTLSPPRTSATAFNNNQNNNHLGVKAPSTAFNNQNNNHSGVNSLPYPANGNPNNNHFAAARAVPTPNTPAPADRSWSPMQQRAQQNDMHSFAGTPATHNSPYTRPATPAPALVVAQGQAQGQSHSSSQNRQNH